jgi:uncharacterized protein DUF1206
VSAVDAKQVAESEWVERLGRVGLLAKGAIYGIVGALALAIPLHLGGKTTDRQGALRTVAQQPHGELLLFALAAGFSGYAVWRFAQAFFDRDHEGKGPKALARRVSYLARGLLYAGSAAVAFALVAGLGASGSNEKEEAARVLELPFGRWVVGGVGVGFLAAGAYNLYRSLTGKFRERLREHEMSDAARGWAIVVGVVGHAARAVVFALVGLFLVKTAVEFDPRETVGLDGALRVLAQQRYGEVLLGSVAAGLLAYALYCCVQARYRRV